MSDSANLVGAFLRRKRISSGAEGVVVVDVVSLVDAMTACLGMNPAVDIRPLKAP